MLRYSLYAILFTGVVCGCGADDGLPPTETAKVAEPPTFGKTDAPFGIVEQGRFTEAGTVAGEIDGVNALSYRFNGFGDTRVRIELSSPGQAGGLGGGEPPGSKKAMDAYVVIDGPHPGGDGRVVASNDDHPSKDTLDSYLEVTLPEAGAYRILVGSYGTFQQEPNDRGAFELSYECLENCEMKQIALGELLAVLTSELGEQGALDAVTSGLGALFPDPAAADAVKAQLGAALADPNVEGFPVLPLDLTDTAQGLFEGEETAVEAPGAVHFDVAEILSEGCSAKRSEMKPVDPRIPGLTTGSFADYTLDDCTLQRAQAFAEVLNNLALDNGSTVTYEKEAYGSIDDVMTALLLAGHRIVITNDRFFADFLGLFYNGAAVAAPMWLKTTIPLADGSDTLAIPSPHTHHTITVSGPLVNATIMFYMGVSAGTSFRAVSNIRSPWTGLKTLHTYDSAAEPERVRDIMVAAGHLRKLWTDQAAGLPAGGYGTLGVCNDSTAVIEYQVENGAVSIFPLAHPVSADVPQPDPGNISATLATLPSDVDGYESAEALNRVLQTLPFDNLDDMPFPRFVAQIRALAP